MFNNRWPLKENGVGNRVGKNWADILDQSPLRSGCPGMSLACSGNSKQASVPGRVGTKEDAEVRNTSQAFGIHFHIIMVNVIESRQLGEENFIKRNKSFTFTLGNKGSQRKYTEEWREMILLAS